MPKIPLVNGDHKPKRVDPDVPYAPADKLKFGHTLHFAVYSGVRNPIKMFQGTAMVDESGIVSVKPVGNLSVGGLTALEATYKIEAAFRAQSGDGIIHLQLEAIETVPLITAVGAVKKPQVVRWVPGTTVGSLLAAVGGRSGSNAKAVYITRKGFTKLFTSPETENPPLEAGDLVNFSGDL